VSILTGKKGIKILDNTFPSTKERVADLVLELEDSSIFHLELQTQNDKKPLRMIEYYLLLKHLPPEKIANILDVSVEFVEQVIKETNSEK